MWQWQNRAKLERQKADLEDQQAVVERQIAEVIAYEEKIGPLFTAVTHYHDLKCVQCNDEKSRGCGFLSEPDEGFQAESDEGFHPSHRYAKGRWVARYMAAKAATASAVGKWLSDEQFMAVVRAL